MKETLTRSLSGLFYISVVLFSIFFSEYAFISTFIILGIVCNHEFQKLIHFDKKGLYVLLVATIVLFHYFEIPWYVLISILILTITTQFFLIKDLVTIRIIPMYEKRKYLTNIFFLITAILFLTKIPFVSVTYDPIVIAGSFFLIWTNDTFAYIVGKNFGKHKLLERISPNKTKEGFLGGLIFAMLAGVALAVLSKKLSLTSWLIMSAIISIFGTLGDLIQSKFKRQAGVKDSGVIMPGHGGIFDRLDSIIFASPFLYAFLQILRYVS